MPQPPRLPIPSPWTGTGDLRWGPPAGEHPLRFDVKETPQAYVFTADLPGVDDDDVELTLAGDRMTVAARRERPAERPGEAWLARERRWGRFSRTLTLPVDADPGKVQAGLQDGVLRITVPKAVSLRTRHVALRRGEPEH